MIRLAPKARSSLSLLAMPTLAAAVALAGCTPKTGEVRTIGPAEPAQRAATSFVHCVEAEGGGCISPDPKQASWDAFALLQWLGAGSPISILQALRRELEHHRDPLAVQDRFVVVTSRYRESLRGAECTPESATPMTELLPKLSSRVETRLQTLGLWREDLEKVVAVLLDEAGNGLADGWLVHMTCFGDPYELWIATAKHDDRQVVVGMLTSLPSWLGGGQLDDERVEGRLANGTLGNSKPLGVIREGTVDTRWVPIPIEEF
jgi:hypothetical protein